MFEAGRYYVGDLCYLFGDDGPFSDDAWIPLLKQTNYLQGDEESGERGGVFEYGEHMFFSSSTQYGDGCYEDQSGRDYGVDAGIIGCFPVAAFPEGYDLDKLSRLGHVIEFDGPFTCDVVDSDGNICIGDLVIATGGNDDNEEDDYEESDDEDESDEDDEDEDISEDYAEDDNY